ncbi:MAG: phosphoribosyltransferase [Labilithrix sp.]|nr:phosphoribosyltransferase [Labilithrix sp.]
MTPARPLTIALPKGRTVKPVAKLLERAGVVSTDVPEGTQPRPLDVALSDDSRALVRHARFGAHALELLLLKPDDVPTYVEYGTADLGVCGRDVLVERDVDVYQPLDLGIGRCRLVVAGRKGVPAGSSFTGQMPRVATKYPRAAAAHFASRGVQVEIVNVQSSVELAPLTGLADVIVDLVETGTTLAENGLEVQEEILGISTLLVANRASYKLRLAIVGPLVDALRAALAT